MISWALLLFVLGISLVWLEFLLPGLILGTLGVIALVASIAVAVYAYPEYGVFIVVLGSVAAVLVISLGLYAMAKTKILGGLVHKEDQRLEEGYSNVAVTAIKPGMRGKVITPLRPSGTIAMGDERVDAVSNGAFIELGAEVSIVEVHGNRVVVELVDMAGLDGGPGSGAASPA